MKDSKTEVLYVSKLIDNENYTIISKCKHSTSNMAFQRFHSLLAYGLSENMIKVTTISMIDKKYHKILGVKSVKSKNIVYKYVYSKENSLISNLITSLRVFNIVLKKILFKKNKYIIIDVLNVSTSIGVLLASLFTNIKVIGIVTDIPDFLTKNKFKIRIMNYVISRCNSYVLLAKPMESYINVNKRRIIIEGMVEYKGANHNYENEIKDDIFIITYAGLLEEKYGVKMLIDAYLQSDIPNSRLCLYGKGSLLEFIHSITDKYSNVIYGGNLSNSEILLIEQNSSLLVNPRPGIDNFTKYSFPSKNLEYMSSGKPTVIFKLEGIPSEYYDYVYTFKDYSIESMSSILYEISQIASEQLLDKGKSAQEFVLRNKNYIVQAKKIINFITNQ